MSLYMPERRKYSHGAAEVDITGRIVTDAFLRQAIADLLKGRVSLGQEDAALTTLEEQPAVAVGKNTKQVAAFRDERVLLSSANYELVAEYARLLRDRDDEMNAVWLANYKGGKETVLPQEDRDRLTQLSLLSPYLFARNAATKDMYASRYDYGTPSISEDRLQMNTVDLVHTFDPYYSQHHGSGLLSRYMAQVGWEPVKALVPVLDPNNNATVSELVQPDGYRMPLEQQVQGFILPIGKYVDGGMKRLTATELAYEQLGQMIVDTADASMPEEKKLAAKTKLMEGWPALEDAGYVAFLPWQRYLHPERYNAIYHRNPGDPQDPWLYKGIPNGHHLVTDWELVVLPKEENPRVIVHTPRDVWQRPVRYAMGA